MVTDFLEERGATINFEHCKMTFNDTVRESRVQGDASTEHRALTIFTMGKEGHSPQRMQRTEGKRTSGSQPAP